MIDDLTRLKQIVWGAKCQTSILVDNKKISDYDGEFITYHLTNAMKHIDEMKEGE